MRTHPAALHGPFTIPFLCGIFVMFAFSLHGVPSSSLACYFSPTPTVDSVQELAHRSGVVVEGKVQEEGLENDINREEKERLLRERARAKGNETQGQEMEENGDATEELLSNRTTGLEPYLLKVRVHQVWAVKAGGLEKDSIISVIWNVGEYCLTLKKDSRYIFFMEPTNDTSVFKAAFPPVETGRNVKKDINKVLCGGWAPPKLKDVKSMQVEEGRTAFLKCEARAGNPAPDFKWYKDGKVLSGKNKPKGIRIKKMKNKKGSEIRINKAAESHSGSYRCEAINQHGTDSSTGNLTVIKGSTSTPPAGKTSHVTPCSDSKKNYCVNGGECYTLDAIPGNTKYLCRCPNEFTGDRCQNYVMPNFYKHLGIGFMEAEELYQKRILTITGICIALLVVGIMCVVAYCKTKKQRKMLHDRLRQSLRSERNNMASLGNGPQNSNPPTENLQLVNYTSKNAIPTELVTEKETETSFSTSQYTSTTHHSATVTRISSQNWSNGPSESLISESQSVVVTSSVETSRNTTPLGHRGRLNATRSARDLNAYIKSSRDTPDSYKDSPHSERYVSAMTTPNRMSPVDLHNLTSPKSPPSEVSQPMSSLATSVPSVAISPLGEEERPLLLVTPPRMRDKHQEHPSSQYQRNSAHYNHAHEAHSPPPSPLRIVEDDEYETTPEYEPAAPQPTKKLANGRRAKRTKLNGHVPHKLESDSDTSSESSSSESETEDERVGEDTPFLSIQNPLAGDLELGPALRPADGSRTNTNHKLAAQEDLQVRLSSVIANQDPIAV
ncbi:pro-neuregulin-1, membrane-bound isoform isoform X2 [Lepisosteus oculatus]|uniref:pro-neuregulin-1, membrane-bound isoform isoform X2 n=1 Tax=Lepisosteus oculatus TaxID=7918 RepID=UPI003722CD75